MPPAQSRREQFRELLPRLTRVYGLKPWELDLLTEEEFRACIDQLPAWEEITNR